MRFLLGLALAQLRLHRGRWVLLGLGVALVVAVPVVTSGLSREASDQSVRRTVAGLDVSDRTLLVTQQPDSAFYRNDPAANDRTVRAQLATLTAAPVTRVQLYRELGANGITFRLGGVDRLAADVRIVGGRLPRSCTPTRCEAVLVGPGDSAEVTKATATLGVVVVGRAVRRTTSFPTSVIDPSALPLVLTDGADAVGKLAALDLFNRAYFWIGSVDAGRVVDVGVPAYVRRSRAVETTLAAKVGGTTFVRPDDTLQAAADRADVSARRFGLLGGFAAVLLLGFAVVAAIGLRRESGRLHSVLRTRGATRTQIGVVVATESVAVTVLGSVAGFVLGGAVAASRRDATGLGATGAAARAVGSAAVTAGLLAAATAVVLAAVLLWPDAAAGSVWRLLDFTAVACLGAALLAGDRGNASASDLAAHGDPLVVALPVLASVVAGLVAARLWGPAVRLAERMLPRRSISGRIGLLGALRRPLRPVATTAFLTAAVASVVFAGAYRATLLANDADQAAYQVPLDATVAAPEGEVTPTLAADAFGGRTHTYGVLRTSGTVTKLAGVTAAVPLLGVDADGLRHAHRWDRTSGSDEQVGDLATALRTAAQPGPTVPAGTRTLTIHATGADPQTSLNVWLRDATAQSVEVVLTIKGDELVGAIPAGRPQLTVVAFGVSESPDYATHHAHNVGEGKHDESLLSGTLVLGTVAADGAPLAWDWSDWSSKNGTATAAASHLTFRYKIDNATIVAVPGKDIARVVPVAVDADTAKSATGDTLNLRVDTSTTITARVVAQLPRLPTVDGPFVLADLHALAAAIDLSAPGRNPTEFWVTGHVGAVPDTLAVTRSADLRRGLDADPIGRGARTLLLIVGLLALGVGALALVLLVIGERRDGAAELYAWEADGIPPGMLRRALAVRALAVAAVAIPLGVAAGLVLARVGTTLVAVDAAGADPTPPLEATLGSLWTPLALLVGLGAGLVGAALVAASSLRERHPEPAT